MSEAKTPKRTAWNDFTSSSIADKVYRDPRHGLSKAIIFPYQLIKGYDITKCSTVYCTHRAFNLTAGNYSFIDDVLLNVLVRIDFRDLTIDEAENLAYFELEYHKVYSSPEVEKAAEVAERRNRRVEENSRLTARHLNSPFTI